ncbi:YARHG domain-containing protein [Xanthobacter sp. TB0139]|uniref:YARHG domain-containing protein n=1 Tax=Xanthobacter sp. TB0139 TaxID=3459178 RepID=UPI004039AFB9
MPRGLLAAVALAGGLLALSGPLSQPAEAQELSQLSCRALWYQRNAIYAQRGYCFKTADAIATFGPCCFPPYGKLTREEQRYVEQVRYWEARKGCR